MSRERAMPGNTERQQQKQVDAVVACCRSFFLKAAQRDPQVMSMLASQITYIGSSRDEVGVCPEEVRNRLLRDFQQMPSPVAFTEKRLHVECLSRSSAVVLIEFGLQMIVNDLPITMDDMRGSLVFVREAGAWKIAHLHLSRPDRSAVEGESFPLRSTDATRQLLDVLVRERTRKLEEANRELADTNRFLLEAMDEAQSLHGLLPVCAGCKKIRVSKTYWETMEEYLERRTLLKFTHGLCPECVDHFFAGEQEKEGAPSSVTVFFNRKEKASEG